MKRIGEEPPANDIARSTELKRKSNSPASKTEGHNVLESPMTCVPLRSDSRGCVISLVGSAPLCSLNSTAVGDEEFTAGNFRGMSSSLINRPSSRICREGQWHHLHQLASGSGHEALHGDYVSQDDDRIMLRAREQYMKMNSEFQNPNFLSRKGIDQKSEEFIRYMRARDNMIISSKKMPIGSDTQLRNLSETGFSQFFVKRNLKGKGVVSSTEARREFGNRVVGPNDEKLGCSTKIVSDSSLCKDPHSSHGVNRYCPQFRDDGMCLRDWLILGYQKRDRVESLRVFMQIVELVHSAQSDYHALQDLQPSYFYLGASNRVIYAGSFVKRDTESALNQHIKKKRPVDQDMQPHFGFGAKHQKLIGDLKSLRHQPQFTSSCSYRTKKPNENDIHISGSQDWESSNVSSSSPDQQCFSATEDLEEQWYRSPEELTDSSFSFSSNIYGLGVLLFELVCHFESSEMHFAAMSNLRHRILPIKFLSENPKDAGFCLWLLHPDPSSRPSIREILHSELTQAAEELHPQGGSSRPTDKDEADSETLVNFLVSLKDQKQKHASKLAENLRCLEEDIKEAEERYLRRTSSLFSTTHKECPGRNATTSTAPQSISMPNTNEARWIRNMNHLENAYFSIRSRIQLTETSPSGCSDKYFLKNSDICTELQNKKEESHKNQKADLGTFFEGLCRFARYSQFKVCGTLKNGDLLNSSNVICSLSFDRDEEYIAAAGVSKRIKVFEYGSLLNDSVDVHYPVIEMLNKSKLSCVCWNNYIKNYLASTDYDGMVQIWDAGTGQGVSQYKEHPMRAWSVDFSHVDPTRFATGSDDCSMKLWSMNEKNSVVTVGNPANVCCVEFSTLSSHLLAFGSADNKVHCYDLRNTRIPWCTLIGHEKAVSYVKFLDSETIVSASTDNTLKLWDLKRTSQAGMSSEACSLTFRGHTNEKNFVGLSVLDGYIACGSETNEVYSYYRSLPMPLTSHKFGSVDPISGLEIVDDSGQFVSSVCWRQKSNMVVAANSSGSIKLLQMVQ